MESIEHLLGKIHNTDCLEFMRQLPDKCVDLVLTDPPYGTTQNKWDCVVSFKDLWEGIKRITKQNSAIVMTAAQPFATDLINSNREMFRYDLIWYKPLASGFLNANKMPLRNHEHILVFYSNHPIYNPQKFTGRKRPASTSKANSTSNYGNFKSVFTKEHDDYFPQSVIEFNNGDKTEVEHPTQKPTPLLAYLGLTFSNSDSVIFDPFMGSGTTAVACERLGRKWFGCELEPKYCEIANKRIEAEQAQLKLFI